MNAALALPVSASPTCALIYADEAMIRRNRIVRKLAKRGIVVKKELQASSKRFDFTSVDIVVVIVDGIQAGPLAVITNDAKNASKEIIRLPHQESRGWEALDRFVPVSGPASVVPSDADPEDAELYTLLEQERDAAREEVTTLQSELRAARADRDAALASSEKWLGSFRRAETALEQAKLGEKEAIDRTKNAEAAASALRGRVAEVEGELAAARASNETLIRERDAAREAIDRQEKHTETIAHLNQKLDESEKVRGDLKKRLEETKETVGAQTRKLTELQKKLDAAPREHLTKIQDLTARLSAAEKSLADRSEMPPPVAPAVPGKLDTILGSLNNLVAEGLLAKDEAFDRLVAKAVRRG